MLSADFTSAVTLAKVDN